MNGNLYKPERNFLFPETTKEKIIFLILSIKNLKLSFKVPKPIMSILLKNYIFYSTFKYIKKDYQIEYPNSNKRNDLNKFENHSSFLKKVVFISLEKDITSCILYSIDLEKRYCCVLVNPNLFLYNVPFSVISNNPI